MPRRFRFAALVLLVASAGGLTACGDDGGGSSDKSAEELLEATFGEDQSIKSGKLDAKLELNAKGLQGIEGPISLALTGPFESRGSGKLPALDLSLALQGAGTSFEAGAVTTGEKGWLRLQGTTYEVDDATFTEFREGYEREAGESDSDSPSLASLGIDPVVWLNDPEVAGTEEVGGAETVRITAGVDIAKFLEDVNTLLGRAGQLGGDATEDVPSSLTEQQRKDIESAISDARIEIWTGSDDNALRRLRLEIDLDVPEDVQERAGGLSTGTLTFDLSIADLNEDQEIVEPQDAKPISELQELIAGGGTGVETDSTEDPTADATTTPAPSSEYFDCLSAAGNDVAEIQKCAALAGQ